MSTLFKQLHGFLAYAIKIKKAKQKRLHYDLALEKWDLKNN